MKQITVFGATGFIGRHLIRRLARTGALIRVATRAPDKALYLKPMGDVGQIVPVRCNVRSDASVAEAIGQSDVVINLLGILFEKGRDTFECIHVEVAARIARLAKDAGAQRFIQMSALGADINALSHYGRSKVAGEQAVRTFFPDAVVLRPSIVFGPEDDFFNKFARLAKYSAALPLIGGGGMKFQPVYVGDVAEAICGALKRPETKGQMYELGGPKVYTFRELLELLLRVTGMKRMLIAVPWEIVAFKAIFFELMPKPLITRDQLRMLRSDNVMRSGAKGLRELGAPVTAVEVVLPVYLK